MPNHVSQRITRLRELVQQGLHEENLDRAVRECNSLAQDSTHVLVFFTLKSIFKELAETLESGAVELQRYDELMKGVSEKVLAILRILVSENVVGPAELEDLVRTHIVNRNLFRS